MEGTKLITISGQTTIPPPSDEVYGTLEVTLTNQVYLPTVITSVVTNITNITASGGGTVIYADDEFTDWYLPSRDEAIEMYNVLWDDPVPLGGFIGTNYWTSSEYSATQAIHKDFLYGSDGASTKGLPFYIRAIRSFTSLTSYSVRDVGPSGGYIFYKNGNDYLEAAANDQTNSAWSNIVNIAVTGTGTAIGDGQANTTAIISQASHTDSAAKICDDFTSTGASSITARGVCWRIGYIPTLSDDFTVNGSGTGSFTSALTGLTPSRNYYVRAYATTDGTTVYGNIVSFISTDSIVPIPESVGNLPTYRFYIYEAPTSVSYEVYPLNFLSTTINYERDKTYQFYRRKFNGSLLFGTNSKVIDYDDGVTVHNRTEDWDLFWAIEQAEPDAILYLDIHKIVGGVVETYWEGYFSTTDGKFDIDRCTFEVTPIVNDEYNIILDSADIQYNVLAVPAITTHAYLVGTFDQTYTRTRRLYDTVNNNVITYIAQQIIPGVNVVSTFFSDASNYVTGITNELKYITVAQKSDILRYASTDPATTAMLSWNELMNILWATFQVKWFYDTLTDTIYVEHISYFTKIAGLDLRTDLSTQATNKYSYLKEKMPKYEKFSFMEADNENFVGLPIWYDSGMVDQNPDTNIKLLTVPVTTDLEYIDFNPEAIADEGFVFLVCDSTFHVLMGMSVYNYDIRLNMDLSWSNLHDKYFRHNRVLIEGYLNGTLTTFTTAQKTKIQQCSTIACDEFDPDNEITTELGETYFGGAKGTVQTASLHPTGELNLSLLYGPADNAAHDFDEPMFALIQEDPSTCGKFYITLNVAAPLEMHIIVSHEVLDEDGIQDCTGGPETWTINLGETESTKIFTLCNSLDPGWCVNYAWTILDLTAEGYIVDIVTECEC